MSSSVILFQKKVDSVGWCPDELAECYRVVGLLARSGLPVSIDSGLTDEGEPWAIVLREDTGDVLLHMARLDGSFVVVSAAGPIAQRGESLRAVLDAAVRSGGLAMLTRRSAAADSEVLRLHPATLIAAFIAGAWIHTETSQAELLQASARREESGINRTDDARLAGFAAQPPSAALATAAASFVAVAATLHVAQADAVLELTAEDFIQAALELLVTTNSESPVEFANLDLRQDVPVISSAMMSEPVLQEALPANAGASQRSEFVAASAPIHTPGSIDILHFSVQQKKGNNSSDFDFDIDIWQVSALNFRNIAEFIYIEGDKSPEMAASVESKEAVLETRHTSEVLMPTIVPVGVKNSAAREEIDVAVVQSKLTPVVSEPEPNLVYFVDAVNFFYKNAAKILHVERVANSPGLESPVSADENSSGDLSPTMNAQTSAVVSMDTDGALLDKETSLVGSVSAAPVAPAAGLPQAAPSDADMSGSGKPLIANAQQPPPPSNAQLLFDFTTGSEHVVRIDRAGFTSPLSSPLNTGDARKVVVFDAPWLEVKSFMLMPGVMMMEDDLLGGVNRAGMEMKGSPVSLDLGGGLTITLLGVVEFSLA